MVIRRRGRRKWPAGRLIEHQKAPRGVYALYETAWAIAWPHLDDWFMGDWFKPRGAAQTREKGSG